MATGNITERYKPNQNAASTTKTVFEYDARKLFATRVTNEVGHVVDSIFEYGTGTTLQTEGPNERTCVTGCPPGAPLREQHQIRIDGLGRMIERFETVSDDGYVFTKHLAEKNTYVDAPPVGTPTSTTNEVLVDEAGTTWTRQRTDLDGHGRPIKSTVFVQGTAPADQITDYVYNANGFLTSVRVPNPASNSSAQVTYSYTFDSLGRPLTIRRPDVTTPASGANLAYDGRKQTATEVVGGSGGNAGQAESWVDFYGRPTQLKETSAAGVFQTTTYAYDPLDNVKSIIDPQGATTTMQHDFAGRRTQITRPGNRTWKYTYDRNGNVTSEQVPGSTNPPITDPLYTSTFAYDDLDRVTSKVIAPRTMSAADRDLFVTNTEAFTYDIGFKGSLRYWRAYGPSGGSSELAVDTYFDGQGRNTIISESFAIAGYPNLNRTHLRSYYITGALNQTRPLDYVGGTNATLSKIHYDARNLPSKIELQVPQALNIAVQTRNVAGLVTKRRTDLTGPMTFIESNWNYDTLGRVVDQTVQQNLAPTQVAKQALQYTGTDDVKQLVHSIGTTNRTLNYTYDHRHQLKTVTTTSYFGASYNYGAAGRLTSANQTRTATGIQGADPRLLRNVNYVYGSTDPERVTGLTNASNGSTYASYTYDEAGNQLTRSYPASNELFEYVYDGKDQLRRVIHKLSNVVTGSEEYWYDTNGQRMAVVKKNASGTKTEMVWFIGDAEAHYDGAGAITRIYTHLSLGTPVARIERTGNTTTNLEFQFHGLGSSTIAAVAQSGTINARFVYAPFGELLETTNAGRASQGTPVHKRRFNDKYEDDLGGLTYYGARYYDKVLLGWTQADPLYLRAPDLASRSTPRRSQTFMFSLNNPNRYLDPDGLDANIRIHAGDLSSYRSEKERSDSYRAQLLADENWMAYEQPWFAATAPQQICAGGTSPQPGGGCGLNGRDPGSIPDGDDTESRKAWSSKGAAPLASAFDWLARKVVYKLATKLIGGLTELFDSSDLACSTMTCKEQEDRDRRAGINTTSPPPGPGGRGGGFGGASKPTKRTVERKPDEEPVPGRCSGPGCSGVGANGGARGFNPFLQVPKGTPGVPDGGAICYICAQERYKTLKIKIPFDKWATAAE